MLAGGAESLSNVPIQFSRKAARDLHRARQARRPCRRRMGVFGKLRPADLAPVAPAIAEYTTGMTMGESAEKMAKENDISRRAQDEIALLSHQRAAAADRRRPLRRADRRRPSRRRPTTARSPATTASAATARPRRSPSSSRSSTRHYGSLTAGNSSPLTDGGAAVLLMSEERAKALGLLAARLHPLLRLHRPQPRRPAPPGAGLCRPRGARRRRRDARGHGPGRDARGVRGADPLEPEGVQLPEVRRRGARPERSRWGRSTSTRFNVTGGSIAIGHPFGATGARVITQLLYELRRRGGHLGLVTVCAAGGVGFAMVVERE